MLRWFLPRFVRKSLGRRPLLLIGLTGIIISMSVVSYGFNQATYKVDTAVINELDITDRAATQLQPIVGKTFTSDVAFKNALKNTLGVNEAREKESKIIAAAISVNAWLVLIGILGFVASFAMSLGPVMWVLFSEVFPNHTRVWQWASRQYSTAPQVSGCSSFSPYSSRR